MKVALNLLTNLSCFNINNGVSTLENLGNYGQTLAKNCRHPRTVPFQKVSTAKAEPRPKRGFGNSFQPAVDAPQLEAH